MTAQMGFQAPQYYPPEEPKVAPYTLKFEWDGTTFKAYKNDVLQDEGLSYIECVAGPKGYKLHLNNFTVLPAPAQPTQEFRRDGQYL